MTTTESTYQEIKALGFLPGMPNAVNWQHLRRLLISPSFYLRALASGLHDAFFKGSIVERAFNATFWVVILMIALLTQNLGVILTAYCLPRFLDHGAQCLRDLVEHTFDEPGRPRTLASYKFLTSSIILAEEVPEIPEKSNQIDRSLLWIQWGFKMVMHFAIRCYILTVDTINHPTHHYRVGSSFLNHESERMKLIKEGHAIHSNWGLATAIDAFFTRNQE
jgi:hypothetical protein